jgi:hypothetical protein
MTQIYQNHTKHLQHLEKGKRTISLLHSGVISYSTIIGQRRIITNTTSTTLPTLATIWIQKNSLHINCTSITIVLCW